MLKEIIVFSILMYSCVEKASVGLSTDMNCGSRCPVSHPASISLSV